MDSVKVAWVAVGLMVIGWTGVIFGLTVHATRLWEMPIWCLAIAVRGQK